MEVVSVDKIWKKRIKAKYNFESDEYILEPLKDLVLNLRIAQVPWKEGEELRVSTECYLRQEIGPYSALTGEKANLPLTFSDGGETLLVATLWFGATPLSVDIRDVCIKDGEDLIALSSLLKEIDEVLGDILEAIKDI